MPSRAERRRLDKRLPPGSPERAEWEALCRALAEALEGDNSFTDREWHDMVVLYRGLKEALQ